MLTQPAVLALLSAVTIGAGVWLLLTFLADRTEKQAALRRIGDVEAVDERAVLLAASRRDRLVAPAFEALASGGRRLTPAGYRDKLAKQLEAAGRPDPEDLDRFLAIRVLTLIAAPIMALLVLKFYGRTMAGFGIAGLVAAALVLVPSSRVSREAAKRQKAIARALPDVLDLLVISVEAGLGFEQALDRTVFAVPGPLTDEFARMLGEVRAGATRARSLRDLADRIDVDEVRRFILAVLQADKFGVSIGRMLRNQADEVRVQRRQKAQERAQKAPVKMLVPMVFCIFPAIFVVIIGPAILNISENFT